MIPHNDSVEESVEHHHGFLPLGEHRLEVLLCDDQVLFRLGAGLTQSIKFALDGIRRRRLVIQRGLQILHGRLDGRWLCGRTTTKSTTVSTATPPASATTGTASTKHPRPRGHVALELHYGLNLWLDGGELIVSRPKLLLKVLHHALLHSGKIPPAAVIALLATTSLSTTTRAATAGSAAAGVGVPIAAAIVPAAWIGLSEHRQRQHGDQ
jgi:hypothetical protein